LLTALNISATKNGKRKWAEAPESFVPATAKLNKRKSARIAEEEVTGPTGSTMTAEAPEVAEQAPEAEGDGDEIEGVYMTIHPKTCLIGSLLRRL
jgi:hypothetical protein